MSLLASGSVSLSGLFTSTSGSGASPEGGDPRRIEDKIDSVPFLLSLHLSSSRLSRDPSVSRLFPFASCRPAHFVHHPFSSLVRRGSTGAGSLSSGRFLTPFANRAPASRLHLSLRSPGSAGLRRCMKRA